MVECPHPPFVKDANPGAVMGLRMFHLQSAGLGVGEGRQGKEEPVDTGRGGSGY